MCPLVQAVVQHDVGIVRVSDPDRRNVVSAKLSDELADAAELELFAQRWSTEQPDFSDRLRRLRRSLEKHAEAGARSVGDGPQVQRLEGCS
jgi:hypothetical protein